MGRLAGLGVPVYLPAEARADANAEVSLVRVNAGDAFEAAGFGVVAVGGRHSPVYGDEPRCANLGYVIEGVIYHPGDALHVPEEDVETLLVPIQASWLKTSEALDFVRAISPGLAVGIHDAQVNERGLGSLNRWMERESGTVYRFMPPGTSVKL